MNWSTKDSTKGFSKEEIFKLLDELNELDTEEIYISGGEPLLYPYIDDAILYANSLGIKVTLATNALEIKNHLEVIKKGVQLVSMSFDGIGETHDKLRGTPGAFDNCVNMFELLRDNNVKTRISAMIWKDNVGELEDMISLAKEKGVSKVNLAFLIPEGRAKTDEEIKISTDKYQEIANKVTKLREKYKSDDFDIELRRINRLDENSIDCPGGCNLLHINVHGKVSPCSWLAKIDKNDEFSDYWPNKSLKECVKKFDNLDKVKKERKKKYGYCGCIAIAQIYNGDFLAEDPLNSFIKK
jgi:MoaA/NifB/PqqE/SkfB family radical SAM enzyme